MLWFFLFYVPAYLQNTLFFVPNGSASTYLHNRHKEWVPAYELTWTNFIKKKNQPHMQLQNRETDYRYDSKQHSEQ